MNKTSSNIANFINYLSTQRAIQTNSRLAALLVIDLPQPSGDAKPGRHLCYHKANFPVYLKISLDKDFVVHQCLSLTYHRVRCVLIIYWKRRKKREADKFQQQFFLFSILSTETPVRGINNDSTFIFVVWQIQLRKPNLSNLVQSLAEL